MRIEEIGIRNFRTLRDFRMRLDGRSAYFIGENASGKTSLLKAVALVLGRDRSVTRHDFSDIAAPIEIEATLQDITDDEASELAGAIEFGPPRKLKFLFRATWNADAEEVEVEHLLPTKNDRGTKPDERAAIPLVIVPAQRDARRILDFGIRRSVMGTLLEDLDLEADINAAATSIASANKALGSAKGLDALLKDADSFLTRIRPPETTQKLSVADAATTPRELLGHLEVHFSDQGPAVPLRFQSSGIAQILAFSFLFHLVNRKPGTILAIDEPESSLHPQAQRALMRLLSSADAQILLATHSSNLLERSDVRRVHRLRRTSKGAEVVWPRGLSDAEAKKLARFTSAQTAEAFFARTAILVEGPSDKIALEALAERQARNLDSLAVSIVALDGAETLSTFLRLLGRDGFQLNLLGLCDADKEASWKKRLEDAGYGPVADRKAMEALGFFVAVQDLEDELVRALGDTAVVAAIVEQADESAWNAFSAQPTQRAKPIVERLRAFLAKGRKVRYAPILIDKLPSGKEPEILKRLMSRV